MQKSPYKFLDSYSKEDRDIFFGRDKETEELYSRVFESRILVVYGTSGTGKSSLINCGLANKFNDSDWLPITVRRGTNINRSLFDSLDKTGLTEAASGEKDIKGSGTRDIVKIIRSVYLDHFRPVYIIFDQFEELFIFGDTNEKDELINNVRRVIDSDLQCRFIFSIREEYLAGFTEFEKIIPSFLNNRIRIEKMTRQNAIQVIEGPCHLNQITVEPGFSEKMLGKLNPDNPDVELTYLQVYLDKVFRLASQDGRDVSRLTGDLLDRAGDVKDLLGTFLEEQISQLDDPESGMVILKSFVSVKGTKHQVTEEEVTEYSKTLGKDIDRETVRELIQKFIRLRILRDKDENGKYELRHDSLAAKIYEDITLVEKELLEVRQFLENAYGNYEKRELFLTEDDLNYIAPYEDNLFLNEKITKFISQSKWSIHKAKRRRQNAIVIAAAIIIIILSFFSIWAFRERSNAMRQSQVAEMQKNSAVKAKEEADAARQEAVALKNLAVEKENLALLAQRQSEEAREEALAERENALKQKNIAEKLSVVASEQAHIATEEKHKAEEERAKAIIAEGESRQLGLLSTAQNLALKSSGIEKNNELMGLLAVQAFNFNRENNGRAEDPIIYEALSKAYTALDSSRHSVFTGSQNEICSLKGLNDEKLMSADLDGQIRTWSADGTGSSLFSLSAGSPVNFIGLNPSGKLIITQHDDNDLILWDAGKVKSNAGIPTGENLTGHSGFAKAVVFDNDGHYMATAGRDSSVIVWDIIARPVSKVSSIETQSDVKAVAFCGSDTIAIATGDGSIILWNFRQNENTELYLSPGEKPISLAWNSAKEKLVAGCSNGTLLLFSLVNNGSAEPERHVVHTAGIDLITFNSDFSLMATSSWDKTIKFYNFHEFFELDNPIGSVAHIRNLGYRIRSLAFTSDNRLAAGLSDKSIRIWETSSQKLADMICDLLTRDMTEAEWHEMVGAEIPYGKTCNKNPL